MWLLEVPEDELLYQLVLRSPPSCHIILYDGPRRTNFITDKDNYLVKIKNNHYSLEFIISLIRDLNIMDLRCTLSPILNEAENTLKDGRRIIIFRAFTKFYIP